MSSSDSSADPRPCFVGDASVIINLNGTRCAVDILRALPGRFVVTEAVLGEMQRGESRGHTDFAQLTALINAQVVEVVPLGQAGGAIYESLVEGTALRTLDDGEAATIGYAHESSAIALLDERKARSICAERFSGLAVMSTAELLMHPKVLDALGAQGQIEAMMNALRGARMRVPHECVPRVIAIIGDENAALCTSLPRLSRTRPLAD